MNETRRARLESVIREELTELIRRELKDPRVPDLLTVTQVNVTQEGDHATILVSILGLDDSQPDASKQMKDCLTGLTSASGFFRRHLARALNVRHIPSLAFKEDKGLKNTQRVNELLQQIEQERQQK